MVSLSAKKPLKFEIININCQYFAHQKHYCSSTQFCQMNIELIYVKFENGGLLTQARGLKWMRISYLVMRFSMRGCVDEGKREFSMIRQAHHRFENLEFRIEKFEIAENLG